MLCFSKYGNKLSSATELRACLTANQKCKHCVPLSLTLHLFSRWRRSMVSPILTSQNAISRHQDLVDQDFSDIDCSECSSEDSEVTEGSKWSEHNLHPLNTLAAQNDVNARETPLPTPPPHHQLSGVPVFLPLITSRFVDLRQAPQAL